MGIHFDGIHMSQYAESLTEYLDSTPTYSGLSSVYSDIARLESLLANIKRRTNAVTPLLRLPVELLRRIAPSLVALWRQGVYRVFLVLRTPYSAFGLSSSGNNAALRRG